MSHLKIINTELCASGPLSSWLLQCEKWVCEILVLIGTELTTSIIAGIIYLLRNSFVVNL